MDFGIKPMGQCEYHMIVNNATDTLDFLMHTNILWFYKKKLFNINNDLIKVKYNCIDIVIGPMWSSWAKSLQQCKPVR